MDVTSIPGVVEALENMRRTASRLEHSSEDQIALHLDESLATIGDSYSAVYTAIAPTLENLPADHRYSVDGQFRDIWYAMCDVQEYAKDAIRNWKTVPPTKEFSHPVANAAGRLVRTVDDTVARIREVRVEPDR
jgi:hypothetical protein